MAFALFILGASALVASFLGVVAPRRPHSFEGFTFFIGWLAGDLAGFHLVAKIAASAALVTLGGADRTMGQIGLAAMVVSMVLDVVLVRRHRAAAPVLDAALREVLGADAPSVEAEPIPFTTLLKPFPPDRTGVRFTRDLEYGPAKRNRLDVLSPEDGRTGCPVLLQIHGGAWFSGKKEEQGQPLMRHLVREGWVCVAPNYRLSPKATFPDHLVDVKMALAWVREHIAEYGGDPSFICVTGGSAGGHLAALVGLTANMPEFQPGFEDVDTSVAACVPVYAVVDFLNTAQVRHGLTLRLYNHLMSRMLMKTRFADDDAGWRRASPLSHVRAELPPFFVVQGAQDTLVWREEPRHFVEQMRAAGNTVVGYAEVPYAQHAFDIMVTRRSTYTVRAVTAFLQSVHAQYRGVPPLESSTSGSGTTSSDTVSSGVVAVDAQAAGSNDG
jgi:acetyl esterase/lipase